MFFLLIFLHRPYTSISAAVCRAAACSAGLTIVPVILWEGPWRRRQGAPTNCQFFTTLFWRLNVEKTFTNHKFHVGLHVTFGLKDRRIPIQYPSWPVKGFGEAIELLIARWVKLYWALACSIFVLTDHASWSTLYYITLGVDGVEFGRFVVISIVRRSPSPRKF